METMLLPWTQCCCRGDYAVVVAMASRQDGKTRLCESAGAIAYKKCLKVLRTLANILVKAFRKILWTCVDALRICDSSRK